MVKVALLLQILMFGLSLLHSSGFIKLSRGSWTGPGLIKKMCSQESVYSKGLEELIEHLNNEDEDPIVDDFTRALALANPTLEEEASRANFWMGGSFKVQNVRIENVYETHMDLKVTVNVKGKLQTRKNVKVPFISPIGDETDLKRVLIEMAYHKKKMQQTANLARLTFGENFSLPSNFRWNDVPHEKWVRSYMYTAASNAFSKAITDHPSPISPNYRLK